MPEPIPATRRIYLMLKPLPDGRVRLTAVNATTRPPDTAGMVVALISRGVLAKDSGIEIDLVSDLSADPALKRVEVLGDVTIARAATVAIAAGIMRVTASAPTGAGVTSGQALLVTPIAAVPVGYAIHHVEAVTANRVTVTLTTPLIAIGGSFSIPLRLIRIN